MNEDTRLILEKLETIGQAVGVLQEDVSGLKEDVQMLKEDVQMLKEDVQMLKEDVQMLKEDVRMLKEDVQMLKEDVKDLKIRMDRVEEEQKNLRLILENETNKKIQVIAEGHHDLARYLNEVREFQKEKEHMKIEILNLKIDMRHVKEKLSMV